MGFLGVSRADSPDEPPREWFEENFVHDGKVAYCSGCQSIPFSFIGHFCTGIEAILGGFAADQIEVPYRWEDVRPVENGDRPGDWALIYQPVSEHPATNHDAQPRSCKPKAPPSRVQG